MRTKQLVRPDAGWYPDPDDEARQRYWDGGSWTAWYKGDPSRRSRAAALSWILAVSAIVAVVVSMTLWSGIPARLSQPGALLSPAVTAAPPPEPVEAGDLDTAVAGTVMLKADCGPGCGAVGGAVAITGTDLITAAHLVATGGSVVITDGEGRAQLAQVLDIDPDRDLALLRTGQPHDLPIVVIRTEPAEVGEAVHAAGFPGGKLRVSAGSVTDVRDIGTDGVTDVQTDAAIDVGNSGGPLLDARGRLIGVVVREHSTDPSIGWAVSAADIGEFLASGAGAAAPVGPQNVPGTPEYNALLRELLGPVPQD